MLRPINRRMFPTNALKQVKNMREMLRFFICFLLIISFDMGGYAGPYQSGAMNSGSYNSNACDGKDKPVELTNKCPSVPQLRLYGNQELEDDEFLYASYSTYESLKKEYDKRPAACKTYFSTAGTSFSDGVYECDNSYCKNSKVVVLNAGHAFKGSKISKIRAYMCVSGNGDLWKPFSGTIYVCSDIALQYRKDYKSVTQGNVEYLYKVGNGGISEICQVSSGKSKNNTSSSPAGNKEKTSTKSTKITVSGTIIDKDTGGCVSGATVYYSGVTAPIGLDKNCNFSINNIAPGTSLKFSAGGFKEIVKSYTQDAKNEKIELNKVQNNEAIQKDVEDKKIGQPCPAQYAKRAVWQKSGKEIKCVAKECNPDRYLFVNSKGESQGYCIANTCKAPEVLNIIDGTKTDGNCINPEPDDVDEEDLPTSIQRPGSQVAPGDVCDRDLLDELNANSGSYVKNDNGTFWCNIDECKPDYVKQEQDAFAYQGEDGSMLVQTETCVFCNPETHTINENGECVEKAIDTPATNVEDGDNIVIKGKISGDDNKDCLDNADIAYPFDADVEQESCEFQIVLQTPGDLTFSADGYESLTENYTESVTDKIIVLKKSATDEADDEDESEQEKTVAAQNEKDAKDKKIQELKKKAEAAHEREHSKANKMLGAAGIGATGIGGMMLMQGLSEQSSDADAEEQMRAYLSTFMCKYGDNSVQAGASDVELPGGNALLPLYSEYVTLANDVKAMKNELGLKPGIESESILDSATSGLYDDVSTGKNSGAFASLSRALMNPEGEDAKKWAEQTAKTQKNVKTGAITAGAGVAVGIIGDIAISAIDKKKAEKADKDSDDDDDDDDTFKPKKRSKQ